MPDNDIRKKAEMLSAEVAAAKQQALQAEEKAASLEKEVKEQKSTIESQRSEIDNLDASMKSQASTIEDLQKKLSKQVVTFKQAFREVLSTKKAEIESNIKAGRAHFTVNIEMKDVVSITSSAINPNQVLGMQSDPVIHGAPAEPNVFLQVFGMRPRTGNKLTWIEATAQNSAGYLDEMTANSNKSDVVFAERTRQFAKIGHYMAISTEVEDWFEQIYQFCINEGNRMTDSRIDAEICAGNGSDNSHPNHVYGIKGQATAFSALAALSIKGANIADVILDAADQAKKENFMPGVCFLTWALYRNLKNLKDDNGNPIFDKYTGMLDNIRVYPTSRLSSGELIVADAGCPEVYGGNSFEIEFERNPSLDGYNVYFRKAVQVKVPAAKKKGIIYVANAATAIAALMSASETTNGQALNALAGTVNDDNQVETHPNT